MKNLAIVTGLLAGLTATAAQAGTVCKVASEDIATIEIQRDGGEENLTVTNSAGEKARLLVLRNHGGVTVAIVDSAITGSKTNAGLMMVKNANGTATVAINGDILSATCEEK